MFQEVTAAEINPQGSATPIGYSGAMPIDRLTSLSDTLGFSEAEFGIFCECKTLRRCF